MIQSSVIIPATTKGWLTLPVLLVGPSSFSSFTSPWLTGPQEPDPTKKADFFMLHTRRLSKDRKSRRDFLFLTIFNPIQKETLKTIITYYKKLQEINMTRFASSIIVLASIVGGSHSFAPTPIGMQRTDTLSASYMSDSPFYAHPVEEERRDAQSVLEREPIVEASPKTAKAPAKKKAAGGAHKEGLLSPLVIAAKKVIGDDELNKLRGKVIGIHSDVIGKFVETHETPFGQQILKALFTVADQNKNGTIEEEELETALRSMGFDLKPKQIKGVFARADADSNGALDMEEFMKEAPKTLRTNLIKLAKKNGGDMGLLA